MLTVLNRQEDESNGGVRTHFATLLIPHTEIHIKVKASSEDNTDGIPNAYVEYFFKGFDKIGSIDGGKLYMDFKNESGESVARVNSSLKYLTNEIRTYCEYNNLHLWSY